MRVLITDVDEVFLEVAQDYLSHCEHEVNNRTIGLETAARWRRDTPLFLAQ